MSSSRAKNGPTSLRIRPLFSVPDIVQAEPDSLVVHRIEPKKAREDLFGIPEMPQSPLAKSPPEETPEIGDKKAVQNAVAPGDFPRPVTVDGLQDGIGVPIAHRIQSRKDLFHIERFCGSSLFYLLVDRRKFSAGGELLVRIPEPLGYQTKGLEPQGGNLDPGSKNRPGNASPPILELSPLWKDARDLSGSRQPVPQNDQVHYDRSHDKPLPLSDKDSLVALVRSDPENPPDSFWNCAPFLGLPRTVGGLSGDCWRKNGPLSVRNQEPIRGAAPSCAT